MYPVKANKLTVTSAFGPRTYTYQGRQVSDYHKGIDLIGGSEIVAFDDGVVTATCNSGVQYGQACYVRIKHPSGWQTLYYHLKSGSVCVSVGQSVKRGQKLGIMGATGQATGVHLHFQIDKGSSASAINPYDYVFNGKEFGSSPSGKKSNEEIAREVIRGDWGNGDERKRRLAEAGYDYGTIQSIVNQKLSGNNSAPQNRYYTVVRGDTLWGIAQKFYGNGSRYPEIARANNIANPDIIHVGQKLLIP
jgi:LysM repeat protein